MRRSWTFGRKLGAGLGLLALLAVVGGSVGVVALQSVVRSKDALITEYAHVLTQAGQLQSLTEERVSGDRAYLLSREEKYLTDLHRARQAFEKGLADLLQASADPEARRLIEAISRAQAEHKAVADRVLDLRRKDAPLASVIGIFDSELEPRTDTLRKSIDDFVRYEQGRVKEAQAESSRTASFASGVLIVAMVAIGLGSVLVAVVLARALSSQLGSAVAQTQSSALQLQGSANQQATGAREQSTALSEITTTIRELLATSRQIAESAQHVSRIADESAAAARGGEGTVGRAHESIASIRKQVDLVVAHMLDLGKKSHQIGNVLEIVSELAEQTNILAINATIEAAGAGEAGRRFAVVADEIRKLADRVGGSTKEIRGLIEDVRNSVNTTVMATESGSKSVDAGTRQFAEVASAFGQIAGLVGTANQAAKEIELSTKQQATAIAQVDIAISNVAQAAREAEATTGQVLETASALATLSRRLGAVIRPEDSAA